VILVVASLVGVLSASLFGGRLRRLASLPLRHLWVVWFAIVVQVLVFEVFASTLPSTVSEALHFVTYAIALSFLWLNRHIPGALAIAVGAACNLAAITANGGVMPASPSAWQRAGLPIGPGSVFENSRVLGDARLALLGDVFAVPAGWPLANVFSIGDVIIALAATYLAHAWCRRPHTSTAWPAPDPTTRALA
jgi:Family of unknown function (DUF5317)